MEFQKRIHMINMEMAQILSRNTGADASDPMELSDAFFKNLPVVYDKLQLDIDAMFAGDPAAKSREEVIRSYPGFYAIAAYRIANSLSKLGVSDIPRMITEHAHGKTGIDIHPNANIGDYFCIDHGTGVVIGETTDIGKQVKIYQGVTLGALSVNKEDAKVKRHPTIEDNVVIYAGATILGGNTVIGKNSIVGGNVWLTKSIPPNSKVYYQAQMHTDNGNEKPDVIIFK
jgi:serine O-acetyltransferase